MRSRPELTVYLTPSEASPGDRLHVRIRLDSHSITPYDAVDVALIGREARYKRTTSTGKTTHVQYHRRDIVRLGARFEGGILSKGVWERDVNIDLPVDLPPTYKSSLSTIEYELSVRVHIPWWPDRTGVYVVKVKPLKTAPKAAKPCLYSTQSGEIRSGEPVIELSLEDEQLFLGGTLEGAIAVSDLGKRRLRRVELSLSSIETALVQSTAGPAETDKRTWTICESTPENGKSMAFRLNIPKDVPTTFQSPFIRVDHALEARAVVAFGSDISLRVPALVLRGSHKKRERTANTIPPLVGHERHSAVWQAAVAQIQLPPGADIRFEPEAQAAILHVGDISVQIREELRSDTGPCLVASMEYPTLGLDLRLAERSWTEFGSKFASLDKKLQKRFTISAREEAQAAHLLNPGVARALGSFHEVGLSDDGAVLMRKGGVHQITGLQRFIIGVYELAQAMWTAISNLPPPQSMAQALQAYQRFAQQKGIRLRRADCALPQWTLRGVPLMLDHRWDGVIPVESRLWTPKPQEADSAGGNWKQALEAVGQGSVVQDDERIGLVLPLVQDPEELSDLFELFSTAISRISGAKIGPYR